MPRAHPLHSAQRAITQITLGAAKAMRAREDQRAELGLEEVELQFQVEISGTADSTPIFIPKAVVFDFPFHYAPAQRDSDLERPHFTFGFEASDAVMITVGVSAWDVDSDTGAYTGATVLIGASGAEPVPFTGAVHLRFQGFTARDEVEATELES